MRAKTLLQSTVAATWFLCSGWGMAQAAESTVVRVAYLHINPQDLQQFMPIVKKSMQTALRVEPGVLAMYCVAEKNNPAKLTFFEIYSSEEAYQQHRDTPHFKEYFSSTKHMVLERKLTEAIPVEIRDKQTVQKE